MGADKLRRGLAYAAELKRKEGISYEGTKVDEGFEGAADTLRLLNSCDVHGRRGPDTSATFAESSTALRGSYDADALSPSDLEGGKVPLPLVIEGIEAGVKAVQRIRGGSAIHASM